MALIFAMYTICVCIVNELILSNDLKINWST